MSNHYMKVFYSVFEKYNLKSNEAIIYSHIKSYSSIGEYYTGSPYFLAKKFNLSRQSVYNILEKLEEKYLIKKTEKGYRCLLPSEREHVKKIDKKDCG